MMIRTSRIQSTLPGARPGGVTVGGRGFAHGAVGLTSTQSVSSGAQVLEKGWTFFFSGVAVGERQRPGLGFLTVPSFSDCTLSIYQVNDRVASLRSGLGPDCRLRLCAEHQPRVPTLFGVLEMVLDSAPTGASTILLGDFNAHAGNHSKT